MDVKGVVDELGNKVFSINENLTFTISHQNVPILEQQNGTGPTDMISIDTTKDAETIAKLLIGWVSSGK